MLKGSIAAFLLALAATCWVFIACVLGATLGALCGWLLGHLPLGAMIQRVIEGLVNRPVSMAEIGAACGFVGPFFRSWSKS
jgi:membrane protein YqaA with SNARE-associated domain